MMPELQKDAMAGLGAADCSAAGRILKARELEISPCELAEAHHGYIPGAKLSQEDRETLALAKDLRENAPLNGLLGIIDAAHRATEQECTCGGNPADDPKCCPACKVYHRLEAAKAASMSNVRNQPRDE